MTNYSNPSATMTFTDLVDAHQGEIMCTYAMVYDSVDVHDVEFSTLAGAQHFTYAARQECWKDSIMSVIRIGEFSDGHVLLSVYVKGD